MSKLVTIAIPFHNPGHIFEDAVKSVFAQTYPNWELLLVNDGSTDGSLERAMAINDTRVRIINDGKNLGLVARLNQIAHLASGAYLARMDADDIMHPERIERQIAFLEDNPDVDVVDTGTIILDRDGQPVGMRGLEPKLPTAFEILKSGGFLHASIMARKSWFLSHLYDSEYPRAEDRELWARTFFETTFAHLPEPLFFYRFAGNVRLRAYLTSYSSERKVIKRYGPKMIGIGPSIYLYLRSLSKSIVLTGLALFRMEQLATRHTYLPISKTFCEEASGLLAQIRAQKVPGW
ncbi:glycosyltransferase family 2 protein [Caldanaerobius polysaccharolyticus]|uniref:glycosyltransferase family 2 protein n=1 Tax=Caldanaerobius polysaccharolyticus TaxID=44256 RepID=UPI0005592F0D|nr:glycosyltransferase family 2 protein [Caldanaerobius polysaccharolyticus]